MYEEEESIDGHVHHLELFDAGRRRRSQCSVIDASALLRQEKIFLSNDEPCGVTGYGSIEHNDESIEPIHQEDYQKLSVIEQIPAVAVVSLLILMASVPFGVAYFPIGWSSSVPIQENEEDVNGPFPLPGKEALGIRMCLFAAIAGQLVMTFTSRFSSPIAFQLLENVPFYHALAHTVIQEQGYGREALSTLFFLFGVSTVIVGTAFYCLGRFQLGRVLYFFPSHVLVGCIGGIGIFIIRTSIEVTNNEAFTFDQKGMSDFFQSFQLFGVVLLLEGILRVLIWLCNDADGQPRFPLLSPIYFCMIVPLFYFTLWVINVDVNTAKEKGYFFPSPTDSFCDTSGLGCVNRSFVQSIFDGHVLDMFRIIDFRVISWRAVFKSSSTILAMASFSLIHVPINIPALAVAADVEIDMNTELIAHGYANLLSGIFCGLHTILTYSFSVLYMRCGGKSRASSLAIVAICIVLFVFGPGIASYFPRCMAGALLLHIGIDLFLEGIYDSFANFDQLEYFGIVIIAVVMNVFGMTAALIAGMVAALSTYAIQSVAHTDPVFKTMSASTLRSSNSTRSAASLAILESPMSGRSRILIIQLQGHIFFGNTAILTEFIKAELMRKKESCDFPFIVILDFSLVVGMDSSAAQAIAKLKITFHRSLGVEVTIYVTGSHRKGFPCDYALADALRQLDQTIARNFNFDITLSDIIEGGSKIHRGSVSLTPGSKSDEATFALRNFAKNSICDSLDEALMFAEDILIAREDPSLLHLDRASTIDPFKVEVEAVGEDKENERAARFLENLAIISVCDDFDVAYPVKVIMELCQREVYHEGDVLWRQGSESDCMKLLVAGQLLAYLEGTDVSELVQRGNTIGELGLVQGGRRLSTVKCLSAQAVLFSLSKRSYKMIIRHDSGAARVIDHIVIRYLTMRVQHVSNRIFETRCLPI